MGWSCPDCGGEILELVRDLQERLTRGAHKERLSCFRSLKLLSEK